MEPIDWNFVIKLLISSGVGLALLKWAAPVLLRQVIRDAIDDVILSVDDHDDRITKNELGVQTHTHELTKLRGNIALVERDLNILTRIERSLDTVVIEVTELGKSVAHMKGQMEIK